MCFWGQGQQVEPVAQIVKWCRGGYPVRLKIAFSLSARFLFPPCFLISILANNSGDSYGRFLWCAGKCRPLGEHYRALTSVGKLVSRLCQVRRAWLKHACWRGEKNQISWCTLVSRRRAQGTPLEWSFIRCLCQVYRIQRGLWVWMCVRACVPDGEWIFRAWSLLSISPLDHTTDRTEKAVKCYDTSDDMSAFDTVPTFCFNPNLGFNPGIIHAARGSEI